MLVTSQLTVAIDFHRRKKKYYPKVNQEPKVLSKTAGVNKKSLHLSKSMEAGHQLTGTNILQNIFFFVQQKK